MRRHLLAAGLGVALAWAIAPAAVGGDEDVAPVADGAEARTSEPDAADASPEPPPLPPLVKEGQDLLDGLDRLLADFQANEAALDGAHGEDRRVLEKQIAEAKLEYLAIIGRLVDNLLAQEQTGLDAAALRRRIEEDLGSLDDAIIRHIGQGEELIGSLRREREQLPAAELLAAEQQVARQAEWLDTLYRAYLDQVERAKGVGLEVGAAREDLSERVQVRARLLAGRLELAMQEIAELETRAAEEPEAAEVKAELAALQARKQTVTASLAQTVKLMGALDLDPTAYQQLLITATGEVTSDIFRPRVALGLVEQTLQDLRQWALDRGPGFGFKLLVFLLILAAFRLLSVVARRVLLRAFDTSAMQASQLLRSMAVSLVSNAIMLVGLLVGLSQLGLELGPLLAGLGIAGFIVGFALQDSLANFAAGMMILGYRPYDVGDLIEAGGVFGRVNHMSLVSTTILTLDNQTLIVPNGKIWGDVIKNVTNQEIRRVDMKFRISYEDDVEHAERVLSEIIAAHDAVLDDPEPLIKLHELSESSIVFIVRPWTRTENYWDVYWDVTREVKRRFDAEGISIPVPHRDLRVRAEGEAAAAPVEPLPGRTSRSHGS